MEAGAQVRCGCEGYRADRNRSWLQNQVSTTCKHRRGSSARGSPRGTASTATQETRNLRGCRVNELEKIIYDELEERVHQTMLDWLLHGNHYPQEWKPTGIQNEKPTYRVQNSFLLSKIYDVPHDLIFHPNDFRELTGVSITSVQDGSRHIPLLLDGMYAWQSWLLPSRAWADGYQGPLGVQVLQEALQMHLPQKSR